MTKSDQIKILNNKIKANNAQYNLDRQNAEISAYSNGDLDKYEYLTKKDLGYKPDALQQAKIEYSPLGGIFYGKPSEKENKAERVGIFQRLKNIDENIRPKNKPQNAETQTDDKNGEDEDIEEENVEDEYVEEKYIKDIIREYANKKLVSYYTNEEQ